MKTLISSLLSFVGWSAILASFFQVFADHYDGAYWSLFWGVVFLQTSRLLTKRALDGVAGNVAAHLDPSDVQSKTV